MSIHSELQHGGGQKFGSVRVTVDVANGECKMACDAPGHRGSTAHFHSTEEIEGAHGFHSMNAAKSEVSKDTAAALHFALQQIKAQKGRR
ncbi:hypothetical protein [Thalassovita sp.]|jgi:hypothetical protein|uniref:hypothetical protein n=1 Tax=Thalassovita sp. TaxID=1979401 RepID=UPI002AB19E46|nr:hypothetical protein [Thalassovita sp.]